MSKHAKLTLTCPECRAEIVVDAATGRVLLHKKAKEPVAGGHDFDRLLAGLDEQKQRAEQVFEQEVAAMKDRDRLLEAKFEEALRRAEQEPDGPLPRPIDLD